MSAAEETGEAQPPAGEAAPASLRPQSSSSSESGSEESRPILPHTLDGHGTFLQREAGQRHSRLPENLEDDHCPSGCAKESVTRFVVVYPELVRITKGTYWSCDVCIAILMFIMTAICEVCIVQIGGDFIVTQSYKQYESSVQSRHVSDIAGIQIPWEWLPKTMRVMQPLFENDNEEQCCDGVECSSRRACCMPDGITSNETHPALYVTHKRLDSICTQDEYSIDCGQPTFQMLGRWDELDVDSSGAWTYEEAISDHANLGCRLQLPQLDLFKAVCRGVQLDVEAKQSLGLPTESLPEEVRLRQGVPKRFFEIWEGLAVLCATTDTARCGPLINAGVFDGALGYGKGSWDLTSALEFCSKLLSTGGVCDRSLPYTFAIHRQRIRSKCGEGYFSAGDMYTNPFDAKDTLSSVSVNYQEVITYELVHSGVFQFFVWIMLILWLVTLNKELESVFEMLDFCTFFPRTPSDSGSPLQINTRSVTWQSFRTGLREMYVNATTPGDGGFLVGKGETVIIEDISDTHRATCWAVLTLRFVNVFYMLFVGVVYACCTHSYLDLLMNTVALAFVFTLPEMFYEWLVPERIKDQMRRVIILKVHTDNPSASRSLRNLAQMPIATGLIQSRFFQGLLLIPIICFAIVSLNDKYRVRPMLEVLRCACTQEGSHCEVGMHLKRTWWDVYWKRTLGSRL